MKNRGVSGDGIQTRTFPQKKKTNLKSRRVLPLQHDTCSTYVCLFSQTQQRHVEGNRQPTTNNQRTQLLCKSPPRTSHSLNPTPSLLHQENNVFSAGHHSGEGELSEPKLIHARSIRSRRYTMPNAAVALADSPDTQECEVVACLCSMKMVARWRPNLNANVLELSNISVRRATRGIRMVQAAHVCS